MNMLMMLLGGVGAILLGLLYIFHTFGPTEVEVVTWGWTSLSMGAGLIILTFGIGRSQKRLARVLLSIGYVGLALFQVFPILLWFAFHGSSISDGAPPSSFVARWLYALPHMILLTLSLIVLYQLWRLSMHYPDYSPKNQ
jgi:hypothetical protein